MREDVNALTQEIIGAALEVHHEIGPGMLEPAYDACLCFELISRGLSIERQRPLPVTYKNQRLDCGYRLDIVVENLVLVEIKAVERFAPVHGVQVLSYLRFARLPIGLLFNFNAG
jgi:GxxExxY protein